MTTAVAGVLAVIVSALFLSSTSDGQAVAEVAAVVTVYCTASALSIFLHVLLAGGQRPHCEL